MNGPDEPMQARVQAYRALVLQYEALDAAIDKLIMEHGGSSRKMTEEARTEYRQLARERSEVLNEMRLLESELLDNED